MADRSDLLDLTMEFCCEDEAVIRLNMPIAVLEKKEITIDDGTITRYKRQRL